MRTLYLHIGFGKTGSSAIQSWLAMNCKILNEFNIFYPNPDNCGYGFRISSGNGEILISFLQGQINANELYEFYFSCREPKTLISSEVLPLTQENFSKIVDFCYQRNIKLEIIAFIRDGYEWLYSFYAQKVKRRDYVVDFKTFIEGYDSSILFDRINLIFEQMEKMPGFGRFHLFHYNRYKSNLLEPFEKVMGIELKGMYSISNVRVNRSLDLNEVFIVQYFSRLNLEYQKYNVDDQFFISWLISDWLVETFPNKESEVLLNSELLDVYKKYCGKFIEKFNAGIGKVMDIELDVYKSSGSIESAESIKAFDVTLLRAICHYMILKNSEIGENRLLYFSRELQLVDWKAALILCPSS